MTPALSIPIDTAWTPISGMTKPDISGWQLLVVIGVIAIFVVPLYWWKEYRLHSWRWWGSALFILGWACVVVLLVAGGIDTLAGDSHAKINADSVATQVLPSDFSSALVPSAITVAPSEHTAGTTLHVPYQGDQLDYLVDFDAAYRGVPVRCRATISVFRAKTPRGSPTRVSARITGECFPSS